MMMMMSRARLDALTRLLEPALTVCLALSINSLVDSLVGCLIGWLSHWLVVSLVGCPIGWLVAQPEGQQKLLTAGEPTSEASSTSSVTIEGVLCLWSC
jgi:hypothetical protein